MPRKPEYTLRVLNKETGGRGTLGVGWENSDGSISISLNPCVKMEDNREHVYTLFFEGRRSN